MRHNVKLPKLGDSVDEVLVLDVVVEAGMTLAVGDVLIVVETDKVEVEVPSPLAGRLLEILVAVDDEVRTGQPIALVEA